MSIFPDETECTQHIHQTQCVTFTFTLNVHMKKKKRKENNDCIGDRLDICQCATTRDAKRIENVQYD